MRGFGIGLLLLFSCTSYATGRWDGCPALLKRLLIGSQYLGRDVLQLDSVESQDFVQWAAEFNLTKDQQILISKKLLEREKASSRKTSASNESQNSILSIFERNPKFAEAKEREMSERASAIVTLDEALVLYDTLPGGVKAALFGYSKQNQSQLKSALERGEPANISAPTPNQIRKSVERLGIKVDQNPIVHTLVSHYSGSSSSSFLDLNKLTNTGEAEILIDLPPEWNEIDTNPLIAIRFGRPHLVQLVRFGTLTVDQVQESINAFAFDLEVNGKGKEINGHALNYFMGILRKGPYAPPANYEPPEVRQMRLYLEAKKREQQTRLDLESQLETLEFDSWITSLSSDERTQLVPPTDFAKPGSPGHNVQLKQYFREKVWPELRKSVVRVPKKNIEPES